MNVAIFRKDNILLLSNNGAGKAVIAVIGNVQVSGVRFQMKDDRCQMSEDRRQMSEDRRQMSEDR